MSILNYPPGAAHVVHLNMHIPYTPWVPQRHSLPNHRNKLHLLSTIFFHDERELLEGITTNLFVLYRNGTIHIPLIHFFLEGTRVDVMEAVARIGSGGMSAIVWSGGIN